MPPDPRKELLKQIRDIRRKIDPAVLAKAERAAQAAEAARYTSGNRAATAQSEVPFDKDNARAGVMMFLQSRGDGGDLTRRIMEEMKKPDAAAKAYTSAPTAAAAKPATKAPTASAAKPAPKAKADSKPGLFKRLFG